MALHKDFPESPYAILDPAIEDIHNRLKQKGAALSLQVDTTATPKHNNGAIFVQTVADYPLVEAISQNVVKHPVLPDAASRAKLVERQSAKYTEKYADYIHPIVKQNLGCHFNRCDTTSRKGSRTGNAEFLMLNAEFLPVRMTG